MNDFTQEEQLAEQLADQLEQLQQISEQLQTLTTVANQIGGWDLFNAVSICLNLILGLVMGYIAARGLFDAWS